MSGESFLESALQTICQPADKLNQNIWLSRQEAYALSQHIGSLTRGEEDTDRIAKLEHAVGRALDSLEALLPGAENTYTMKAEEILKNALGTCPEPSCGRTARHPGKHRHEW